MTSIPDFDSLPPVKGMPQGCSWGFWNKGGKRDNLGTLNLLTADVVKEASKEIKSGVRVQLDWKLSEPKLGSGRKLVEQKVIDFHDHGSLYGFDYEVHFNTQCSSQWDGFSHFAMQKTQKYYNDLNHSDVATSSDNRTHHWVENGGIAARGVLLDHARYRKLKGLPDLTQFETQVVSVEELEDVAKFQGTSFKVGDILIVRFGFTDWYNATDSHTRAENVKPFKFVGVKGDEAAARWIWNHHFAAVVGDNLSFEAWPPANLDGCLHEYLLVHAGTPIGELWNLEPLAKACEEHNRWTFFLTSAPLYVPDGIASPPNAIAVL